MSMYSYPGLSQAEQEALPALSAAPTLLPTKFVDSTHQLWSCETVAGSMVLKLCQHQVIETSHFWAGMNHLFHVQFPASLAQTELTLQLLHQKSDLLFPDIVAAVNNRFLLSRLIPGQDVNPAFVTTGLVTQLAKHITRLHEQSSLKWGALASPKFDSGDWGERLQGTIRHLAKQSTSIVPQSLVDEVLIHIEAIEESDFVPIMPDLRWDQFRVTTSSESLALIDLDAFVIGPASLELVLLEYVLTAQQFSLFKHIYTQTHDWPDYQYQKPCYQLLLFLMNVLGETDVERWMQQR